MAEEAVCIINQHGNPINIKKWKVKEGNVVSVGTIILLYESTYNDKREQHKLKATQAGVLQSIIAAEGTTVKPNEPLCKIIPCCHPTIVNDMCAECGTDLRKEETKTIASVPMIHSIPDLKVSEEQAQKLGKADSEHLIKERKLVLLVDLDQTLIHTTNDNIPPNIKDVYHFQLYGPNSPWYHTRLRPGTHNFLNKVFEYYELHICTFGARNYAHTIAMFLDPDQKFFSNRILSRDECFDPTSKKANLKALFPCGDDMVCIIDDREDVWNHASNLIHVKPYHFFQHTGDINAPPGLDKHESDCKAGVDLTKIANDVKEDEEAKNRENNEVTVESNGIKDNVETEEQKEKENVTNTVEDSAKDTLKDTSEPNEMQEKADDNQDKSDEKVDKSENISTTTKMSNGVDKTQRALETESSNVSREETTEVENIKIGNDEGIDDDDDKQDIIEENKSDNNENITGPNGKLKDLEEPELEYLPDKTPKVTFNKEENLIEIEDPDDYLIYLEDILKRIHKTYYEEYDKMESGQIPDLKRIIPFVRSSVLKGCRLVFSGLVPTHVNLENSRAYQVARSLGAEVTQDLEDDTTHIVAVRPGTAKVNAGKRRKNLKIVTPDWLWCCAERWEHVDERIFPLSSKGSKNRHPPPHCSSPEHNANYQGNYTPVLRKRTPSGRFMDTINPLMSFSSDDIADMDKEVEDILEDDESDEEPEEETYDEKVKEIVENEILKPPDEAAESSSSSEDMDYDGDNQPKGHKRKRDQDEDVDDRDDGSSSSSEAPSIKFRRGEIVDDDIDIDRDKEHSSSGEEDSESSFERADESDDGEWNMMGAALEREFLSD